MAKKNIKIQDGVKPEWFLVASYWCEKLGAELESVDISGFGCWKDNQLKYFNAEDLKAMADCQ